VFGALGMLHFAFRKQFFAVTEKFQQKDIDNLGIFNLWNFLFYLSIGMAIVLAVRAGGVIPVFSYLVVPPVTAILLTRKKASVVLVALLVSSIGSILGLYFSVQLDFPVGSSIVAMLGVVFVLATLIRLVRGQPREATIEEEMPT
jgi:ABC-type Mn2+/Zn2+ transport system permease subunit